MSEIIISQSSQNLQQQFEEVLSIIQAGRQKVFHYANRAMIDTYWAVGNYISKQIASSQWGDSVVEELSKYLSRTAPDVKGFSSINLWRMKRFYELYNDDEKLSPLVTEISWTNNVLIMSRCKSAEEREFYLRLAKREHLSKRELERQIDSGYFERAMIGSSKLAPVVRELAPKASGIFKDRMVLEFITGKEAKPENSFRHALITHMKEFILELGKDFLFMEDEY